MRHPWWRRIKAAFLGRRLDRDIQRELDSHLAMATRAHASRGLSDDAARRAALRDFGSPARVHEEVRDVRGLTFWDALAQDVRFGWRTLQRAPGFTVSAILVLALGIGANAAVFSVIRGVLLAPLPFRDGHELVLIQQSAPGANQANVGVSIPELYDYRQQLHMVHDLVEYHSMSFTLLNQGEPDRVDTGVVSANFFDMLGVHPVLGRTFVAADDAKGADAVLVLSHAYWQQKFGGRRDVVGTVVELNNRPHTIVGVLPDLPQYPRENHVYMPTSACPFRAQAETQVHENHRVFGLQVFGRLADGATPEQASAEVTGVAAAFPQLFPKDYARVKEFGARTAMLQETLVRDARPMLWTLSGATLLVLLIACANVANLSLSRTVRRQRELALRTALGAGRGRLLRMLTTESLMIALAGGALGLVFAWLGQGLLASFISRFTPRTGQIRFDWVVLVFGFIASIVTGLAFGAAPALAARRTLMASMREGGTQTGDGRGRQRVRATLVVAQVAVSFVLLVGAALLVESFQRLASVSLGYETEHVVTASIYGNFTSLNTNADALRIHAGILERLRASPGVTAAAVTASVPLSNITPGSQVVHIEGRARTDGRVDQVDPNVASEGYFETLGVPVIAGRTFQESDGADAPLVAVINQSMAKLWDGASPVGGRFVIEGQRGPTGQLLATPAPITVIGVVGDFHLYQADHDIEPQYYQTFRQTGGFAGRLLVRTSGAPSTIVPIMKAAVHAVDEKTPVEDVRTIAELRNGRLEAPGLTAVLLTIFAAIALAVTLAGLAGVIGTSVAQRTREFGLRMALGASRASVLKLVLTQGLVLVVVGLLAGTAGAYGFGRLLATYLFATQPMDMTVYALVATVFLVATIAAIAAPARRATTIDPLTALKD